MSFDNRFYLAAETELNNRKARNERRLESHQREIKQKFPEISAIDDSIRSTATEFIKLIINNEPCTREKTEEIQQRNRQQRNELKQALVAKGYPADYLEPVYSCPKCKDTGIADGRRCECFMELVKRAAADELNKSSPINLSDFSQFSLHYYDDRQETVYGATSREMMAENLEFCRNYAENFHLPCNGILMRGATGLGKTHLSLSIAKVVLAKGYSVIYGSAPDLFRKAEQEHFGREDGNTVEMLLGADLLILDDVGAEFESKFYSSVLYNIINNRMNSAKPTIISTNCDLNELLSRYGDRTVSRLKTMDDLIFTGNDVRLMRAKEKSN
ncbi:MAG: ATP-binding protein [Ruminiclostridium sp.]|nr:ATP-binding protein [Ruminiclostridium sp.]